MTSYDGKCLSFVPGKEVVNREPPVSKYVVEKLYRVHRSRVLQCESVVDCHVHIPKFLTDQTWKKLAAKHKEQTIMQHNEEIYQRLSKVENEESAYTKQTREHIRRVKHKATYMKHLKEVGRLRKLLKIQKENEHMAKRLERARPEYSLKECKQWYKYHESFKNGRRSDPTAGHIMRGMRGLLPSSLPPLESKISLISEEKMEEIKENEGKESSLGSLPKSQSAPSKLASIRGLPMTNDSSILSINEFGNSFDDIGFMPSMTTASSVEARLSISREGSRRSRTGSKSINETKCEETHENECENSDDSEVEYDLEQFECEQDDGDVHGDAVDGVGGVEKDEESIASKDSENENINNNNNTKNNNTNTNNNDINNDKIVLVSRSMNVSNDSRSVTVHVCVNKSYDENLYIQVWSPSVPPRRYSERAVPLDTAYDIITSESTSASNIAKVANLEDMHQLRAMLIDMFKEADDDGNGYLTFDEFQNLMEKVDLGISPQELRFVISEADENENGVVDYHEFVPLAVDMIQSFRARDKAKKINKERDDLLDDQIMRSLSKQELHDLTVLCLQRIKDLDVKKYGVIRSNDLKRCLSANPPLSLTETEISLICQMLPRDPFGRCVYGNFEEVLLQVRFLTMKNAVIESQGSNLQKYLLELCKAEELRLRRLQGVSGGTSHSVHGNNHHNNAMSSELQENYEGLLPFRSIVSLLCNSNRLSLSRLQVMVIMSEASVLDGMINYYQFVPQVSKTIELMFEPKTLRQRAELIETTDLSPEALLQGMTSEMFEQRLRTLFKSYDVDHSGTLEESEFIACLESLDLQLTKGEMSALMSTADISNNGSLQFEEFVQFFTHNLIHLEREKHIRLLQRSIHNNNNNDNTNNNITNNNNTNNNTNTNNNNNNENSNKSELDRYIAHLTSIFKLADTEGSGQLHHQEISEVLKSLEVNISQFELDILLSELDANGSGMIMYADFIPSCAELLRAFRANEKAQESRHSKEQWAESKAIKLVQASTTDMQHIVKYLKERIHLVEETVEDPLLRVTSMQDVLRNPHSGLSRTEANLLLGKLFTTSKHSHNHHNHNNSHNNSHYHNNNNNNNSPNSKHNNNSHNNSHNNNHNHHHGHHNHHHNNHHNHHNQPVLRTNLTNHELHLLVFEVRKQSIMRNLLEDRNPDSLKVSILRQLETECERLKSEGQLESDSNFIPVSSCFQVLSKSSNLRLHRAEIIAIISWADCHDSTGLFMDVKKFAEHASSVLAKIKEAEFVDTKAAVLDKSGRSLLDDSKIMNGLRSKEIEEYFTSKCEKYINENNEKNNEKNEKNENNENKSTIPSEVFLEMIRALPKAYLSEREAVAVLSSAQMLSNSQSNVSWKEFIPFSSETIQSLLKERVMQRRVLLYKATEVSDRVAHEEAMSTMTQLAEKFIEHIKVKSHLDSVIAVLPEDSTANKRPATGGSGGGSVEDGSSHHGDIERVVLIALSDFEVPMLSKKYVTQNYHNNNHNNSHNNHSITSNNNNHSHNNNINNKNNNNNKHKNDSNNNINNNNINNTINNNTTITNNTTSTANSSSALFLHAIKAKLSMLPKLFAKVTVSVFEEDSNSLLMTHNNSNSGNSINYNNNNNGDREIFVKIKEIVETSIEISENKNTQKTKNNNEDNEETDETEDYPVPRPAFESEIKLPVRLPSIALLDSDLAQEFALNLLDRIYLEYEDENDKYNPSKLKVNIIP